MPRNKRDARALTPPPVPHAPDFQHAPDAPVAPEVEARIQELMRRPYRITVQADPDGGGYIARVQEIPECIGAGDTLEETVQLLREAMEGWFLVSIEHGQPIPEPATQLALDSAYSGQLRVRMPKRLHRELAEQAERDGMSLNTLIISYLAREAGAHAVSD